MWWLYVKLFYSFFKIGLFGFGGGYAMISLIQGEVVNRYHWLTTAVYGYRGYQPDDAGTDWYQLGYVCRLYQCGQCRLRTWLGGIGQCDGYFCRSASVVYPDVAYQQVPDEVQEPSCGGTCVPGFASGCGRVVGGGSFAVAHTGKLRYTGQSVAVLYQYFSFCLCLLSVAWCIR